MKKETFETKNLEEKSETKDSETQTEILVTSTGMNTDDTNHDDDCRDDKQDMNKNREIRPKEKETILEMRINHEDLDAEKIETFIEKRLKFSLIGKPWIANNGTIL